MATINLFGASGHGKVVKEVVEAQGDLTGCFYDDAPHCERLSDRVVKKASEAVVEGPLIVSIGNNRVRKMIAGRYDVGFARGVHPSAVVSKTAVIGEGSVVMQGAILQADCVIGKHCIVNSGASVDHECRIGDFVHIAPHSTLCGNVTVGEGTTIGAGSVVIPGISIGRWCMIGAGSVVVRDVPDGATAYGNPCKIKYRDMTSDQTNGGGVNT